MAKIITENFKAETTLELLKSFTDVNNSISEEVRLNFENLQFLDSEEVDTLMTSVESELEAFNPQSTYYIMASVVEPDLDEAGQQIEITKTLKSTRNFKKKVIFGNKVDPSDVRYMFPKNPWISGSVYDAYDDIVDVENLNMFVTVLDGGIPNASTYKVYKCIKNNDGGLSTVSPATPTDAVINNYEVTLSDGYVWKLMFEVLPDQYVSFETSTLIPYPGDSAILPNPQETVSDIIIEETRENLFSKYTSVSKDSGSGIKISRTSDVFTIDVQDPIKIVRIDLASIDGEYPTNDDAFRNMQFITPNEGIVYNIRKSFIRDDYGINNLTLLELELEPYFESQKQETDAQALDLIATSNTIYSIAPKINVTKSVGFPCVAYGVLNEFGTVVDVFITNSGTQYKSASANLVLPLNLLNENSDTVLRCIISPKGGHGSDPVKEMSMSRLGVKTAFSGQSGNIPNTNFYSQVALVKNPEFVSIDPFPQKDAVTGNFLYPETPIESPKFFDNRTYVRLNGSLVSRNSIEVGYIIEKDILDGDVVVETIDAVVHDVNEVTVGNSTFTEVFLVNYNGDYIGKFQRGDDSIIRSDDPDLQVRIIQPNGTSEIAQINNTIDSVVYGNYKVYSGDILHYVDFEKIERRDSRQEKIKFVFDF